MTYLHTLAIVDRRLVVLIVLLGYGWVIRLGRQHLEFYKRGQLPYNIYNALVPSFDVLDVRPQTE